MQHWTWAPHFNELLKAGQKNAMARYDFLPKDLVAPEDGSDSEKESSGYEETFESPPPKPSPKRVILPRGKDAQKKVLNK